MLLSAKRFRNVISLKVEKQGRVNVGH